MAWAPPKTDASMDELIAEKASSGDSWQPPEWDWATGDSESERARKNTASLASRQRSGEDIPVEDFLKPANEGGGMEFYQRSPLSRGLDQAKQLVTHPGTVLETGAHLLGSALEGGKKFASEITNNPSGDPVEGLVKGLPAMAHGALTGVADFGKLTADTLLNAAYDPLAGPENEIRREYASRQSDVDRQQAIEAQKNALGFQGQDASYNVGRNVISNLVPLEAAPKLLGAATELAGKIGEATIRTVPAVAKAASVAGQVAGSVGQAAQKVGSLADNPLGHALIGYGLGGAEGALVGGVLPRRMLSRAIRSDLPQSLAEHSAALGELLDDVPKGQSIVEYAQKALPEKIDGLKSQLSDLESSGLEGPELAHQQNILKNQINSFENLANMAKEGGNAEAFSQWMGRQARMEAGAATNLARIAGVPAAVAYGAQESSDKDALSKAVGSVLPIVVPFAVATSRPFNINVEGNRLADIGKNVETTDPGLTSMAEEGYKNLSPEMQRRVDITKAVLRNKTTPEGKPLEVYPLTTEDYAKYITQMLNKGDVSKEMTGGAGKFTDETGHVVINVDELANKPIDQAIAYALRHETGHAAESAMMAVNSTAAKNVRDYLEEDFKKNPELHDAFQKRYEQDLGEPIDKAQVMNELVAEIGNHITEGKPLEEFNLNPTLRSVVGKAIMHGLDKLGFKVEKGTTVNENSQFGTPMVDKAVQQFHDNLQELVNTMNKRSEPPAAPPTAEEGLPTNPLSPAPEAPKPQADDDTLAQQVLNKAYTIDKEQVKADRQIHGKRSIQWPVNDSVVDDIYMVGTELGKEIRSGKVNLAAEADDFFEKQIQNKGSEVGRAFYDQLSQPEKEAIVNKIFNMAHHESPSALYDYFSPTIQKGGESGFLDETAPNQQSKDLEILGGKAANSKGEIDDVGLPPANKTELPQSPLSNNIRLQAGVGPKADVETFLAEKGKLPEIADTKAGEVNPKAGLTQGYKRTKVFEAKDKDTGDTYYDFESSPQKYLQGRAFNRNDPAEMALLNKAVADSGQAPAVYGKNLKDVEEAISAKNNVTIAYDSASSAALQSPLAKDRTEAQQLADLGMLPRETVEKNMFPTGIRVQDKPQPSFTPEALQAAKENIDALFANNRKKKLYGDEEATFEALQDMVNQRNAGGTVDGFTRQQVQHLLGLLPEEPQTRVYAVGYSPDKAFANADNLFIKAIEDSNLLKDKDLKQAYNYVKSKAWEQDLYDKNRNEDAGYRGDGKIFLDNKGKDFLKDIRDADYKPVPLEDWKVQVLNLIEGGSSPSYAPEAFQNLKDTGRKVDDILKETANPLQNKLKKLGDKLQVVRGDQKVIGLQNIVENATETIRLDRMQGIQGYQKLNMVPSSYGQRSSGFLPKISSDSETLNSVKLGR